MAVKLATADNFSIIDATNFSVWNDKGLIFYGTGNYDEAIKAYDMAININPKSAGAWYNKGLALYNLGKYNESIQAYNESININPGHSNSWYNKGLASYRLGKYTEAIQAYSESININPEFADAWYNKGLALYKLGRYIESIQAYDEALKTNSKYITWYYKGNALFRLGRYNESIQAYDNAININPDFADAWYNKGLAFYCLDSYNLSIGAYDNAIKINSSDSGTWNNKGLALYKLGKYIESIQAYNEAININRNYSDAWNSKGAALYNLGRYNEAIQAYGEALNITPKNTDAWINKGIVLYKLKKYDESIEAYDQALEIDANNADAWYNKGLALYNLGRNDESIAVYEKAIAADKDHKDAWFGKSNSLYRLNHSAEAAIAFAKGKDIDYSLEEKIRNFILILIMYLLLPIVGYALSRKYIILNELNIVLLNILCFLTFSWILAGLFNYKSVGLFLVGGFLAIIITLILWFSLGIPVSNLSLSSVNTFCRIGDKCIISPRAIKIISLLAITTYILISAAFYFRLISLETEMLLFIRLAFVYIFTANFAATFFIFLLPVVTILLSVNVGEDERNILLIFQFGYLCISALFISVILWAFGIGNGVISISPLFIGIMTSLLIFVFLTPYLLGWRHEKRWRELLLMKRQTWIEELLDIFEFPTPSLYVPKLQQLLIKINDDKVVCEEDEIIKDNTYFNHRKETNSFGYVYEEAMQQMNPCASYKNFLRKFKENTQECLNQIKAHEDDEDELTKLVKAYTEIYRMRKGEIAKMLDAERTAKPLLWIGLTFVLTPILTTILSLIANKIGPSLIEMVPRLVQQTGGLAP